MLELAVLGLLVEQPRHGYELKQRLSETLGPLWGISFGSLYPALRRLERTGAIEALDADDGGGPPTPAYVATGSLAGDLAAARMRRRPRPTRRTRRAYRLTPAGQALFAELLSGEDADDDRTFALKLSFCRHLDGPERLAFLERRRAQLAQRLSRARRTSTSRPRDRYTRALIEHRDTSTQHDLDWIDELIADERARLTERTEGAASA